MVASFYWCYPHSRVSVTFGRWRNGKVRVVVHGCFWTQVASGTAGRANVLLCPASSYLLFCTSCRKHDYVTANVSFQDTTTVKYSNCKCSTYYENGAST